MPIQTNEVRISNVITVHKENLDYGIISNLALMFSHENPKFLENKRLGFSNFQTPKTIDLYQGTENSIRLPRGLTRNLFDIIPNLEVVIRQLQTRLNF